MYPLRRLQHPLRTCLTFVLFALLVVSLSSAPLVQASPAGGCNTAGVISSIAAAVAAGGTQTLDLAVSNPPCIYSVTVVNNGDGTLDANGLPLINNVNLIINGHGSTISRAGTSPAFRIFQVTSGATLTLNDLTISGGETALVSTPPMNTGNGGGIHNSGTLILNHSTVTQNKTGNAGDDPAGNNPGKAGNGGGIYNTGTITLTGSIVSQNRTGDGGGSMVSPGQAGAGGGIYNSGTAAVISSTVSNNTAGRGGATTTASTAGGTGGGIRNAGTITIVDSLVDQNSAGVGGGESSSPPGGGGNGGGISNSGTLNVINTTISGNAGGRGAELTNSGGTGGNGGGIYNTATLMLANSTISQNAGGAGGSPTTGGAGGSGGSGAGIYHFGGTASITGSAVISNTTGAYGSVIAGSPACGGGIYAYASLTLINSTLNNNSSTSNGPGGAICASYGGLAIPIRTLSIAGIEITNSTIFSNTAASGGGVFAAAPGGGPYATSVLFGTGITLTNTILATNAGGNCATQNSAIISDGGSNIDDGISCGFAPANGSQSGTNPKLDPAGLRNNGGPTLTIAHDAGSPAINTANTAKCPTTDQRGYNRRSGFCDIGAFEAQPASITVVSGSSPQSTKIGTAFALPLKANVQDAKSNALGGVVVTYAAPASGASAALSAATATTDASGTVQVTATANHIPGSYSVAASIPGPLSVGFSLTNALWPLYLPLLRR